MSGSSTGKFPAWKALSMQEIFPLRNHSCANVADNADLKSIVLFQPGENIQKALNMLIGMVCMKDQANDSPILLNRWIVENRHNISLFAERLADGFYFCISADQNRGNVRGRGVKCASNGEQLLPKPGHALKVVIEQFRLLTQFAHYQIGRTGGWRLHSGGKCAGSRQQLKSHNRGKRASNGTPFQTNRLGERNHEKGSARQLGKFACEWSVRWSVDQKTIRIVNVTQGSIALTNVEQFSDRSNTSIRRIEAFKNHHDFFPLQRGEDFIKVAWII